MPTLRDLNLNDLDCCLKIMAELKQHYGHPIGGVWGEEQLKLELQDHRGSGAFNEKGELEAFCLFRNLPGAKEIMLLASQPRIHRTGAMRFLIRALVDSLEPNEYLWLEVHSGNLPAISLYESLGFKTVGERDSYYSDGAKALLFEYKPLQ